QRAAIRDRILHDPYYRLRSLYEVNIAVELGLQLDVNRATVDDWLRLPGISIHQARSLVELRGMGVQFLCIEDISAAIGLSLSILQSLEPLLYFCYYDPESPENPQKINLNTATVKQLAKIPLIDAQLAGIIVQNRPYRSLADLQQRLALESELISQLMYYLQW
ncbi:ComEA family DNA-binding protein, partial [Spirulina sp. 06S082]|uniref:ComEA family DNA-binding protein n=1 Tax=Spirulina sp. 06S082 TaxID=3110248 RepID=UPI002B220925